MSKLFESLWTERYRPQTLEDIVLSEEDRHFFETLAKKQEIPHLLFAGNPGTGKTSLSFIVIKDILQCEYLHLNASDESGIDVIRSKVTNFAKTKSFDGNIKIVLLDEADLISFEAMKCLLSTLEQYSATCRFIFTCNYIHKLIPALRSRCQIISLNPPLKEITKRVVEILKKENIEISEEQKPLLLKHIKSNLPDLRRIINDIQKFSSNGSLQIRSDNSLEFAVKIFDMLCKKQDLTLIRKQIIENESSFSNDYHSLLKQIFEIVFKEDIESQKKTEMMLSLSHGLEMHNMVLDKEINAFATLINLYKLF